MNLMDYTRFTMPTAEAGAMPMTMPMVQPAAAPAGLDFSTPNMAMGLAMMSKLFTPPGSGAANLANTVMNMGSQLKSAQLFGRMVGQGQPQGQTPAATGGQGPTPAAPAVGSSLLGGPVGSQVTGVMPQAGALGSGGTVAAPGLLSPDVMSLFNTMGGGANANFPYPRMR